MDLTDDDKMTLESLLAELRSDARCAARASLETETPDAKAVFEGAAATRARNANVLRKALMLLRMRGLGEDVTLDDLIKTTVPRMYRCVEYTDDGCSVYECLSCKARWEARGFPRNYCGNCGMRFHGMMTDLSDRRKALRDEASLAGRGEPRPCWIIEARERFQGEEWGEWRYVWVDRRLSAKDAMRDVRRLRRAAAAQEQEEDDPFPRVDYEFRAVRGHADPSYFNKPFPDGPRADLPHDILFPREEA